MEEGDVASLACDRGVGEGGWEGHTAFAGGGCLHVLSVSLSRSFLSFVSKRRMWLLCCVTVHTVARARKRAVYHIRAAL